jgi:hypothetical protein
MLIATFGPSTAWVGMQITHEGDAFVLEGHGPISPADIMEYDRQGHLLWVNDGARAWVGSKAGGSAVSVAPATPATARTSESRDATTNVGGQHGTHTRTYLKRSLLLAIVVLIIANVVLLLTILGVFRGP